MPKFFVDQANIGKESILIDGVNFNHIKNVLRLNLEDEIIINDRQGHDYKCIIKIMDQNAIHADIQEKQDSTAEPLTQVTLFQSLIKGEKMDWVIQKAVEIGVSEIVPLITSRCVVKLEGAKKVAVKVERWNKIAESAAKQSGRGIVPIVREPLSIEEAINYVQANQIKSFIPYEKEEGTGIKSILEAQHLLKYGIFIGPEGGFTEDEVDLAMSNHIQSITLGKRILRSETASLVALTTIMYEMGEME
ncbi:MAG: 16S rRNA (uracil(1498)-N(3))-methyltransferase [Cellulosilyticaceae bacterium]